MMGTCKITPRYPHLPCSLCCVALSPWILALVTYVWGIQCGRVVECYLSFPRQWERLWLPSWAHLLICLLWWKSCWVCFLESHMARNWESLWSRVSEELRPSFYWPCGWSPANNHSSQVASRSFPSRAFRGDHSPGGWRLQPCGRCGSEAPAKLFPASSPTGPVRWCMLVGAIYSVAIDKLHKLQVKETHHKPISTVKECLTICHRNPRVRETSV